MVCCLSERQSACVSKTVACTHSRLLMPESLLLDGIVRRDQTSVGIRKSELHTSQAQAMHRHAAASAIAFTPRVLFVIPCYIRQAGTLNDEQLSKDRRHPPSSPKTGGTQNGNARCRKNPANQNAQWHSETQYQILPQHPNGCLKWLKPMLLPESAGILNFRLRCQKCPSLRAAKGANALPQTPEGVAAEA